MTARRLAEVQPESFEFTPENLAWARGEISKYPSGREASAVIALLWRAQAQNNQWLPRPAIEQVAQMLAMPVMRVLEVATFYTMFNLSPVGRFTCSFAAQHLACCAARRRSDRSVETDWGGTSRHWRRSFVLGRGGVPGGLLQRADGADQRRLLRGFDAGKVRQTARRPRRRAAGSGWIANWACRIEPEGGVTSLTSLYGIDGHSGPGVAAQRQSPTTTQRRCIPILM